MQVPLANIVAVAIGGALGALCRFALSGWLVRGFPIGTLAVNLAGCLLIGYLIRAAAVWGAPEWTLHLLISGFLGSLTTFSTFAYQSAVPLIDGRPSLGLANILANLMLGLALVWIGLRIADWHFGAVPS